MSLQYHSSKKLGTFEYDDTEYKVGEEPNVYLHYIGDGKDIRLPKGCISCEKIFFLNENSYLDLSSFDTSSVVDMSGMFRDCENLQSLDLSSFDTSNVTTINSMFEGCKNLKSLDLSSFDTRSIRDMSEMFSYCKSLQSLDISNFCVYHATNMDSIFWWCNNLKYINFGYDFTISHNFDIELLLLFEWY